MRWRRKKESEEARKTQVNSRQKYREKERETAIEWMQEGRKTKVEDGKVASDA